MSVAVRSKPLSDESGVAMLQVVMAGAMLAAAAFLFLQFLTNSDRQSLKVMRRHENLNFSTTISDYVNDSEQVRGAANVVDQIGAGAPIEYD